VGEDIGKTYVGDADRIEVDSEKNILMIKE
jgi:hypothetical protein